MRNLDEIHAAEAAFELAKPERPCTRCGVPLHTVVNEKTDLFEPADASGSSTGRDPDLAHWFDPAANPLGATSPYDALRRMAELMDAGHKAVPPGTDSPRACLTPLFWDVARAYSSLKVRLDMGMSFHVHTEASGWDHDAPRPPCRPDLPYHCGWPAWLRPSGWYCRRCDLVLDDATAVFPGRAVRKGEAADNRS